MDDQWQTAGARRRDMDAEDALLNIAGAQIVMEVEAGLADADDFWVVRQREKLLGEQRGVIGRLVRVRPDRAPDPVICLGNRPDPVEFVEPGAYRQHRFDP